MNAYENTPDCPIQLKGKVLLGITGSIAAFKSVDLVRYLKDAGFEVQVVLTQNALKFVTPLTLETLTEKRVYHSLWDSDQPGTHHIQLARWADVLVVAPASAQTLFRLAQGSAEDLLSTEALAFQGPKIVVPAMNPVMWNHPATQRNIKTLQKDGWQVLGPEMGIMACGEEGLGRMVSPQEIFQKVLLTLRPPSNHKTAVITLGPTRSYLDPVRYLTNRSSGKMGAMLCWEAFRRGYSVEAIVGTTSVDLPPGIKITSVSSNAEMIKAAQKAFFLCDVGDVFMSSAALLDWEVPKPSLEKLKKNAQKDFVLRLQKSKDLLKTLSSTSGKKKKPFVVGFAAETQNHLKNAQLKLQEKGCDAFFVNDVSRADRGFEADTNAGTWLTRKGDKVELGLSSKMELACKLFDLVEAGLIPVPVIKAKPIFSKKRRFEEASSGVELS